MKRLWLILFFISSVWGQICQYDQLTLYNSFESKAEGGKIWYKWKCSGGHAFWLDSGKANGSTAGGLESTVDNLFMLWMNSVNADVREQEMDARHREILEQQERIALAQMTSEQKRRYQAMKEEYMRENQRNSYKGSNYELEAFLIIITGVFIYSIWWFITLAME